MQCGNSLALLGGYGSSDESEKEDEKEQEVIQDAVVVEESNELEDGEVDDDGDNDEESCEEKQEATKALMIPAPVKTSQPQTQPQEVARSQRKQRERSDNNDDESRDGKKVYLATQCLDFQK